MRIRWTALALLTLLAACARVHPDPSSPPDFLLRGTVRDSATGQPVAGAYIWPIFESRGAVSDSSGQYQLQWPSHGIHTFLVRLCDDHNLAKLGVEFRDTSIVERDVVIAASTQTCSPRTRAPWAVDARDTLSFRGHYIYSWEGGGWLEGCDGRSFHVDWDSPLGSALRTRPQVEGQQTFVRARGRIAEDGLGPLMMSPGPLLLVHRLEEIRAPRPVDCR